MTDKQLTEVSEGNKILFQEDSLPFVIMACNERYAVCTRELNKRKDAQLLWFEVESGAYFSFMEAYNDLKNEPVYTIVDFKEQIRGTENLIFCMGFTTDVKCKEALQRLVNGESEISHRTRIGLNIKSFINQNKQS